MRTILTTGLDFPALWQGALRYRDFLKAGSSHRALWDGLYRLAHVPAWALASGTGRKRHLLVLAEDWCGDASNTVPILARLADQSEWVDLRMLRRDENPAVMDRYLTSGARSIPIVIVLDEEMNELGHWGPRPADLQRWVMENRETVPRAELYPQIRRWYARDRGESTLKEVLALGEE